MKSEFKIHGWLTGLVSPRFRGNTTFQGYENSLYDCLNRIIGLYGQVGVRPGLQHIAEVKNSGTKSYLIPFRYSNTDTYILEFTTNTIRVYEDRAQVQSGGSAYEITTTYGVADIPDIRWVQKFDKIFLVHPDYEPKELARISDTNWTFTSVDFDEPAWLDINSTTTTLTFSAVTGSGVTCTASSGIFAATDVGRAIRVKTGPDDTNSVIYINIGSSETHFDIPFYPQNNNTVEVFLVGTDGDRTEQTYTASAPSAGEFRITGGQIELSAAPAAGEKVVVQEKYTGSGEWGWATITGYTSSTEVTVTIEKEIGGTNPTTEWRLGAFSDTTGYPSKVAFYQGRLWYASTSTQPDRVWFSEIENFYNFSPDNAFNKGQIDDATGGSIVVADINTIEFMEGLNILMLGGEGIKSIGKGGIAVTSPPIVLPEDGTICSSVKPIKNRNEIIFTDQQKKTIYSAKFDFQTNSYQPNTLNILADNLFEDSPIAEMVMIDLPFPQVFVRTENGNIYSCTYKPEFKQISWGRHQVGGTDVEVESIAAIPNQNKSELWMVVKRTIDSSTYRSVEVMHNFFYKDSKTVASYSDSYATYSGSSTSILTGLDHLEGETVEVMGNGGYVGTYTVASGQIDITPVEVTTATVGLNYEKWFETNALDVGRFAGPAKGHYSTATTCYVELYETDGLSISINGGDSNDVNFRGTELSDDSVNPLFSGIKEVHADGGLDRELKIRVEQPYPLPQTVLSVAINGMFNQS